MKIDDGPTTDLRDDAVRSRVKAYRAYSYELTKAAESGEPVEPLRIRLAGMDVDDAYAIQALQLEHHLANGKVLAGRKVGLTSVAMQNQLGVDSPDFGFFLNDMVYFDGAEIPVADFIAPRVEPEFGFLLTKPLRGPGVTRNEAVTAIGEVRAAMEIIDSRIRDWDIALVDTIADNASCGAIVLGSSKLAVDPADLAGIGCALRIDGEVRESGTGSDVMGDPIESLIWLANVLGRRGVGIEAGQVVLPGSFTRALPITGGQSAVADFGSLGAVTVNFI
ncbi:MAG: fumarylacetoacetate hydrolase family protein [Arthrobacter sp.]